MKLAPATIHAFAPFVTGDGFGPYRKGSEIIDLINKYKNGPKDIYDQEGMPDVGNKNGHRPSRTEYVKLRLSELSDTSQLRDLLNEVFSSLDDKPQAIPELNKILGDEGLSVAEDGARLTIRGGVIDKRPPVANQAHFKQIENQILEYLDAAEISINVAVAWFTNQLLADKLEEKKAQGLDVEVVIFDDYINAKYAVSLPEVPVTKVKGSRGGKMHEKFCVLDNQIVLNGSYNWSDSAEHRNDETLAIHQDPKLATLYTKEFRRLKNL
jgi:phosphatidylserine/phosphatidylglycerophosphate/cardiolipin synthase-like enzyme